MNIKIAKLITSIFVVLIGLVFSVVFFFLTESIQDSTKFLIENRGFVVLGFLGLTLTFSGYFLFTQEKKTNRIVDMFLIGTSFIIFLLLPIIIYMNLL